MNIEELKRLADAASDVNWMHLCRENPVVFSGKYAAYIAAANPAAVLELIRQRDELLAALKEVRDLGHNYTQVSHRVWIIADDAITNAEKSQ